MYTLSHHRWRRKLRFLKMRAFYVGYIFQSVVTINAMLALAEQGPWKNATVPYLIDTTAESFNKQLKSAMDEFHVKTCVRFVDVHSLKQKPTTFVRFVEQGAGNSCGSVNPNAIDPQKFAVGGCKNAGEFLSALMNLLGWVPEHLRVDRDKYVAVSKYKDYSMNSGRGLVPRLVHLVKYTPSDDYGFSLQNGRYITDIGPTSIAARAGLKTGDRILAVNGESVEDKSHYDVVKMLGKHPITGDLLVVDYESARHYEHMNRGPNSCMDCEFSEDYGICESAGTAAQSSQSNYQQRKPDRNRRRPSSFAQQFSAFENNDLEGIDTFILDRFESGSPFGRWKRDVSSSGDSSRIAIHKCTMFNMGYSYGLDFVVSANAIVVTQVLPHAVSAHECGLEGGHVIISVNGKSAIGISEQKFVKRVLKNPNSVEIEFISSADQEKCYIKGLQLVDCVQELRRQQPETMSPTSVNTNVCEELKPSSSRTNSPYCMESVLHPPVSEPLKTKSKSNQLYTLQPIKSSTRHNEAFVHRDTLAQCDLDRIKMTFCPNGMHRKQEQQQQTKPSSSAPDRCLQPDGKATAVGKTVTTNFDNVFKCTFEGVFQPVGCSVRSSYDETIVELNAWYTTWPHDSYAHQCSPPQYCLTPVGALLQKNMYTEGTLIRRCGQNGNIETLGCSKQPSSSSVLLSDTAGYIRVGDKATRDDGVSVTCMISGIEVIGCERGSGMKPFALGKTYVENSFKINCTESGPVKLAYVSPATGAAIAIGETFVEDGVVSKITKHGPKALGCKQGSDDVIAFGYQFHDSDGFVRLCTTEEAKKVAVISPGGTEVTIGQRLTEHGVVYSATLAGLSALGCAVVNGSSYVTIALGAQINQGDVTLHCSLNGTTVISCTARKKQVSIGQSFIQLGYVWMCTAGSGPVAIGCSHKHGIMVPFGSNFTRNRLLKLCLKHRSKPLACLSPTKQTITIDASIVEWEFVRRCTDRGLVSVGCHSTNGRTIKFNETSSENGFKRLCTKRGWQKLSCVTSHGDVKVGSLFVDGKLQKNCTTSGVVPVGCYRQKTGAVVAIGEQYMTSAGVRKQCNPTGSVKTGCMAGDGHVTLAIGQFIIEAQTVRNCTEKGLVDVGCQTESNHTVLIGQQFHAGEFKMHCSADGVTSKVACVADGDKEVKILEVHTDDEFQYKCTEQGLVKIGCNDEGTKFEFGSKFVDGSLELECTDDGIVLTGCVYKQQQHMEINQILIDDNVIIKCTEGGSQHFGCFEAGAANRTIGEQYRSRDVQKVCTANGPSTLRCYDAVDKLVAVGALFEDDGVTKRCTENGVKVENKASPL